MSNWLQAIEEDLIVNEARDPSPLIYRGDWESEELKYELLKVFSLNTSNFDVRRFKNSIRAFTPIGIRAILPIYLRHCAKSKDSEVAEYLMYFLSDPGNGLDNNDAFTSVFNEKEKKVICDSISPLSELCELDLRNSRCSVLATQIWCAQER